MPPVKPVVAKQPTSSVHTVKTTIRQRTTKNPFALEGFLLPDPYNKRDGSGGAYNPDGNNNYISKAMPPVKPVVAKQPTSSVHTVKTTIRRRTTKNPFALEGFLLPDPYNKRDGSGGAYNPDGNNNFGNFPPKPILHNTPSPEEQQLDTTLLNCGIVASAAFVAFLCCPKKCTLLIKKVICDMPLKILERIANVPLVRQLYSETMEYCVSMRDNQREVLHA
jgi:hypothetical protein